MRRTTYIHIYTRMTDGSTLEIAMEWDWTVEGVLVGRTAQNHFYAGDASATIHWMGDGGWDWQAWAAREYVGYGRERTLEQAQLAATGAAEAAIRIMRKVWEV